MQCLLWVLFWYCISTNCKNGTKWFFIFACEWRSGRRREARITAYPDMISKPATMLRCLCSNLQNNRPVKQKKTQVSILCVGLHSSLVTASDFSIVLCFLIPKMLLFASGRSIAVWRMSFVDFGQCAEDHARILILVLPACGPMKPRRFNKIFDRITRLETVNVPGSSRSIHMRYRKYYAIENNAWGDYQVHRRALGLIMVGNCEEDADVQELFCQYEQLKVWFACAHVNVLKYLTMKWLLDAYKLVK